METNAPQTPSSPEGAPLSTPIQDNPVQHNPQHNPVQPNPAAPKVSGPARPKGPNVSAIVLGLIAVVLAGLIIANETTGLQVDWSQLGPGAIVGIGVVMALVGAIGLTRRRDDS